MTARLPDLKEEGPILNLEVQIPTDLEKQFKKSNTDIPESVIVKALIDTGASHSVIRSTVVEKLKLTPVGKVKICTPSTADHECLQYFLRLRFPKHDLTYQGVFTATGLDGQSVECLIGRDILSDAILIYLGKDNSFTLSLL